MPTNQTQLRSNIWVGNYHPAHDPTWLAANSITAIINCAREINNPYCGVKRYKQGLLEGAGNTDMEITCALQCLHDLLDEGKVVLVHDFSGLSRCTYVAARVIAARENANYDDIYTEIRGLRPETQWPEVMRPLYGP